MVADVCEVTVENTGETYLCPYDTALLDAALELARDVIKGRVVEARDELREGRLPRARGPHERDGLPRLMERAAELLAQVRQAEPALATGDLRVLETGRNDVIAWQRGAGVLRATSR